MQDGEQIRLLMLGASGRLGRLLSAAWPDGPVRLLRQGRSAATGPGWISCDPLADPDGLRRAMGRADVVLNLAGPVPRGGQVDLHLHSRLALAVLRAARQAGVRQVFLASSAAIYGARPGICMETDPPAPVGPYGHAKHRMEDRVRAQLATTPGAPPTTILRIGNVAGADQLLGRVGAVPLTLDRFANGQTPRRSYIGPRSLARVLAELVTVSLERALPSVLNVAAPGSVSMAALLRAAGQAWSPAPASGAAIAQVTLDTRLLRQHVDFTPAESTAAGIVAQWRATCAAA
ncbi:NAD-dependent epimerase/dehydratase family protein [Actibacterium ureilyticum]|uniref:NAD-dependent epimerase/dehydratase family protein n=1 Tax=Actibacterium ureilyticum TaxID=1590614 RepID=UPI000BAAEC80|nr:NAD(P)-dependent oxidoreductase [Actibacterium ureilyticum]